MSAKYTFLAWDTPIANAPLKLALLQLANNADDDGFSFYSISKMSESCGMSERTFIRKITELEKMGVLTVERRPNRPSLYTLIGDEMGVTLCHLHKSGVTECHAGVTECHGVGDRVSHDLNSTPNNTPNNSKNSKKILVEDAFSHWWSLYPSKRRNNKKGCFNKWLTICKKLSEDDIEVLTTAISEDIVKRKNECEDIKFFLQSTTYINQERWKDGE